MMTANNDDKILRLERVFKASPGRVYEAWTDPNQLLKWWGPEGMTVPKHDLNITNGGSYRTTMVGPDGSEHTVSGVYKELIPNQRVVMTWGWEQDGVRGHETEIRVEFEAKGEGTVMRFEQAVFDTADSCQKHSHGWSSSFNKLPAVVE